VDLVRTLTPDVIAANVPESTRSYTVNNEARREFTVA
jgi:hypothetical protein